MEKAKMYAETVVEDHLSGCTGDIDIKYCIRWCIWTAARGGYGNQK